MIRLMFQATGDEEPADRTKFVGSGQTVIQAVADLERQVHEHFDCWFTDLAAFSRDFRVDDFEEMQEGESESFYDFSCPEERFEITRLAACILDDPKPSTSP